MTEAAHVETIHNLLLHPPSSRDPKKRIGVELERLGFYEDGPFSYRDRVVSDGERRPGAATLLKALAEKNRWPAVKNAHSEILGLNSPKGKISLEPGSQVEFSAHPVLSLFEVVETVQEFENGVAEITNPWNLYWLGVGVNPFSAPRHVDLIPSARYDIMDHYLPQRGGLAQAMMRLTSSIQVNLDYHTEEEGIEMLRAALALAPIHYALFANSPFFEGMPSRLLSHRALIWSQTDNDRSGIPLEVFDEGFDFKRYARLACRRPLMFVTDRQGQYQPSFGRSLDDVAKGALDGVSADDHNCDTALRQLFFEARLKPGFVEVRSLDGQRVAERYAAIAWTVGILYSNPARKFLIQLATPHLSTMKAAWLECARDGLKSRLFGRGTLEIARELLRFSKEGLRKRGLGEEFFLAPVEQIIESEINPGQSLVMMFNEQWKRKLSRIIRHAGQGPSPAV